MGSTAYLLDTHALIWALTFSNSINSRCSRRSGSAGGQRSEPYFPRA